MNAARLFVALVGGAFLLASGCVSPETGSLDAELEARLARATEAERMKLALAHLENLAKTRADALPGATGRLIQLLPADAVGLFSAAAKAAPSRQVATIARAAMTASPADTVRLTSAAIQMAPNEAAAILEAASWRVPKELKPQLEQLKASLPKNILEKREGYQDRLNPNPSPNPKAL